MAVNSLLDLDWPTAKGEAKASLPLNSSPAWCHEQQEDLLSLCIIDDAFEIWGKLAVQEMNRVVEMQISFGSLLKQRVHATSIHLIGGLRLFLLKLCKTKIVVK